MSKQRFHINKYGNPAPCKAKDGNCPLGGGGSPHFDTEQAAQTHINKENEKKFGLMSGMDEISNEVAHYEKPDVPNEQEGGIAEKAPVSEKISEVVSDKPKRLIRTKMKLLDTEEDYIDFSGYGHGETVRHYHIEGLDGQVKTVDEVSFNSLKSSGFIAREGESVFKEVDENEGPQMKVSESKRRLIDMNVATAYHGQFEEQQSNEYKVMDSSGNAKWIDANEYEILRRSGNIATEEEYEAFPDKQLPDPEPEPEPEPKGFFGRLRNRVGF